MNRHIAAFLGLTSAIAFLCVLRGPPTTRRADENQTVAAGQDDADSKLREALARRYLEITGGEKTGKQIVDGLGDQLSKIKGLPPGYVDKFKAHVHLEEFHELLVPILTENFDTETLKSAVEFFASESGQKFSKKQPIVFAETQKAAKKWAEELRQRVMSELKEENKEKDQK